MIELMLVFASLRIRTKVYFYSLKMGTSRKFKAKNFFLPIIQLSFWLKGCVAFRQIYEIYRRLNLLYNLTRSLGFPSSNRCFSASARIASGFVFLMNLTAKDGGRIVLCAAEQTKRTRFFITKHFICHWLERNLLCNSEKIKNHVNKTIKKIEQMQFKRIIIFEKETRKG